MHHAMRVRRGEPAADVARDRQRVTNTKRASRQLLSQALSLHVLADEVSHALVLADVVHRENVGMIQRAGRTRLGGKPIEPMPIVRIDRFSQVDRRADLRR